MLKLSYNNFTYNKKYCDFCYCTINLLQKQQISKTTLKQRQNICYKMSIMVLIYTFIKWSRTSLWYSGAIWFLHNIVWQISLTGEVISWWSRYDINYTIWYIIVILKGSLKKNRKEYYKQFITFLSIIFKFLLIIFFILYIFWRIRPKLK